MENYCFKLSNGQSWQFVVTEELKTWARKFFRIIEVNPGFSSGFPRIILMQNKLKSPKGKKEKWSRNPVSHLNNELKVNLPKKGWRRQCLGVVCVWRHLRSQDIICEMGKDSMYALDIIKMWCIVDILYKRVLESGGFPFHAGFVQRRGFGFLLSASGNIGKSTCCRRIPSPWQAVSDDEALIVKNKAGQYFIHPFPTWSDYLLKRSNRGTWKAEKGFPLSAIFFLEQAGRDEVIPLTKSRAAILMNESAGQVVRRSLRKLSREEERQQHMLVFKNVCAMAHKIPAYILRVSLTGKFWEEMEKTIPQVRASSNYEKVC